MPINISYQPAAAAIAGPALLAGQGDYNKWRAQFGLEQWQAQANVAMQQQQMAQQRMLALMQMQQGQQQQGQQQQFELAQMPMQADLEQQKQANLMQLQSQAHSDQAQQQFGYQQQLQESQQQGQLANQQAMASYNDQLKQQQQVEQLFQNPLAQHLQNVQKAQQSGYSFAPPQQQQVDGLKKDIGAIQSSVADGSITRGSALPALRQKVAQLNAITPSQPPPETTAQKISKNVVMGIPGPDGKPLPGTESTPFTVDAKDGTPMVLRGWKPPDTAGEINPDTGEFESEKARGMRLSNQIKERKVNLDRTEWVEKHLTQMLNQPQHMVPAADPATGQGYVAALKQDLEARYDQAAAGTPSGVHPVGPATQPGQSPTGQPTGAPAGGQGAPQPQQTQQTQQAAMPHPVQTITRLKQIPRHQWTLEDWAHFLYAASSLQGQAT